MIFHIFKKYNFKVVLHFQRNSQYKHIFDIHNSWKSKEKPVYQKTHIKTQFITITSVQSSLKTIDKCHEP